MSALKAFLVIFWLVLAVYTGIVIADHGANLFPQFFGDMMAVDWAGQFNLDFVGFLVLSASWTAWRHEFSGAGLGLAVVAFFGGMGYLCIYLMVLLTQTGGDLVRVLLGDGRAAALRAS